MHVFLYPYPYMFKLQSQETQLKGSPLSAVLIAFFDIYLVETFFFQQLESTLWRELEMLSC